MGDGREYCSHKNRNKLKNDQLGEREKNSERIRVLVYLTESNILPISRMGDNNGMATRVTVTEAK